MEGKLIVLCGISGSGKSTWAHNTWKENPFDTIIVSRDNIRYMFGYTESSISEYYHRNGTHKLEKEVTKYEDTLIYEGLEAGKTVIVDATHLKKGYLKRFEYWNVPIEYKYFDVSLKDAIERDNSRNRKVGANIVKKQYNRYLNLQREGVPVKFEPIVLDNVGKQECYVFDIDGCLADNCGERSPFDWDKVSNDKPIKPIVKILNDLNVTNEWEIFTPIYICSGRDDICKEDTIEWFKNNVYDSYHFKFMLRKHKDCRPDWIVKQEMAQEICKTHTITAWFDDRLQVTRHLRALGIKVLNVEHNNF